MKKRRLSPSSPLSFASMSSLPNALIPSSHEPLCWKRRCLPTLYDFKGEPRRSPLSPSPSPSSPSPVLLTSPKKKNKEWNIFYLNTHGNYKINDDRFGVLDAKDRFGIPILALGSQGSLSYFTFTLVFFTYLLQKWKERFLQALFEILHVHGQHYLEILPDLEKKKNKNKMETQLLYLFRLNQLDLQDCPTHYFRLYYHSEKIQNVFLHSKHEVHDYYLKLPHPFPTSPYTTDRFSSSKTILTEIYEWAGTDQSLVYMIKENGTGDHEISMEAEETGRGGEVSDLIMTMPLGLHRLDKKFNRVPSEKIATEKVLLQSVLSSLQTQYPTTKNFLFLHCCRGEIPNLNVQKVNKQDLMDMLLKVRITPLDEDPQKTRIMSQIHLLHKLEKPLPTPSSLERLFLGTSDYEKKETLRKEKLRKCRVRVALLFKDFKARHAGIKLTFSQFMRHPDKLFMATGTT